MDACDSSTAPPHSTALQHIYPYDYNFSKYNCYLQVTQCASIKWLEKRQSLWEPVTATGVPWYWIRNSYDSNQFIYSSWKWSDSKVSLSSWKVDVNDILATAVTVFDSVSDKFECTRKRFRRWVLVTVECRSLFSALTFAKRRFFAPHRWSSFCLTVIYKTFLLRNAIDFVKHHICKLKCDTCCEENILTTFTQPVLGAAVDPIYISQKVVGTTLVNTDIHV